MTTTANTEKQLNIIRMDDGRDVEFAGKKQLIKSHTIDADGNVVIRLDFVNGETRTHKIVPSLLLKFAAHGAEQKLGDEVAGVKDVEDMVQAIDELLTRLEQGEWNVKREANGMAGASILAKALIEMTGKDRDTIKAFLAAKTQAEKVALRSNGKLKPIIDRLEAEKAARAKPKAGPTIDTDELLAGLDAPAEGAESNEAPAE